MRLLVEEVCTAYAASLDGRTVPDQARTPFSEFVRWWHARDRSGSEQFWAGHLAGIAAPRPLPGYLGGPVAGAAEPMTAQAVLSRADSDLIRQAAGTAGLKSSTMVTAAWALLRARYGGVSDVVLAVTRSCRADSVPGAEGIIGLLINTVPLRVQHRRRTGRCASCSRRWMTASVRSAGTSSPRWGRRWRGPDFPRTPR